MSGKQKNQEQKRRKGQESILKMQISKKLAKGKMIREIAQELEMEESEMRITDIGGIGVIDLRRKE